MVRDKSGVKAAYGSEKNQGERVGALGPAVKEGKQPTLSAGSAFKRGSYRHFLVTCEKEGERYKKVGGARKKALAITKGLLHKRCSHRTSEERGSYLTAEEKRLLSIIGNWGETSCSGYSKEESRICPRRNQQAPI